MATPLSASIQSRHGCQKLSSRYRATLPAASPADLVLRTDPEAEVAAILRTFNAISMAPETPPLKAEPEVHEEFDHTPEPQATGEAPHSAQAERVSAPPLTMVPENHSDIASEFAGPADSVVPVRASTSHTTGPDSRRRQRRLIISNRFRNRSSRLRPMTQFPSSCT